MGFRFQRVGTSLIQGIFKSILRYVFFQIRDDKASTTIVGVVFATFYSVNSHSEKGWAP